MYLHRLLLQGTHLVPSLADRLDRLYTCALTKYVSCRLEKSIICCSGCFGGRAVVAETEYRYIVTQKLIEASVAEGVHYTKMQKRLYVERVDAENADWDRLDAPAHNDKPECRLVRLP